MSMQDNRNVWPALNINQKGALFEPALSMISVLAHELDAPVVPEPELEVPFPRILRVVTPEGTA